MANFAKNIVNSEIGKLEGVIIHTPSSEVENMTPSTVERALYSDILSLDLVSQEYSMFRDVLKKVTKVYEVKDLLSVVLKDEAVRDNIINKTCQMDSSLAFPKERDILRDRLKELNNKELSTALIEGLLMKKDTLSKFVSDERFALRPLHNLFFTRDGSVSIYDKVLVCKMASDVRDRESLVMHSIFENHPELKRQVCNPISNKICSKNLKIEGGDVLIARDDILLVGNGIRTSTEGIDYLIQILKSYKDGKQRNIVVQELPESPESFIHLDMVFTFLDKNLCMVYEPLIVHPSKYRTIHISVQDDEVKIEEKLSLLGALSDLGMDLHPITCGGDDLWHQEREQWHSGANFFAFAPGKIIGYRRNINTAKELENNGFAILEAEDVTSGKVNIDDYKRCMVRLGGSELPRGGGGARCMTMPVGRAKVEW